MSHEPRPQEPGPPLIASRTVSYLRPKATSLYLRVVLQGLSAIKHAVVADDSDGTHPRSGRKHTESMNTSDAAFSLNMIIKMMSPGASTRVRNIPTHPVVYGLKPKPRGAITFGCCHMQMQTRSGPSSLPQSTTTEHIHPHRPFSKEAHPLRSEGRHRHSTNKRHCHFDRS